MNLSEFKAWFEGFTESMDGPPNAKAWARIQKQVKAITPEPTKVEHIYHNYPWIRERYWGPFWSSTSAGASLAGTAGQNTTMLCNAESKPSLPLAVDMQAVFADIGREEAKSISE